MDVTEEWGQNDYISNIGHVLISLSFVIGDFVDAWFWNVSNSAEVFFLLYVMLSKHPPLKKTKKKQATGTVYM